MILTSLYCPSVADCSTDNVEFISNNYGTNWCTTISWVIAGISSSSSDRNSKFNTTRPIQLEQTRKRGSYHFDCQFYIKMKAKGGWEWTRNWKKSLMQVIYVFPRAIILFFQITTWQKKLLENSRCQIFLRAEIIIMSIVDSLKRRNMDHHCEKPTNDAFVFS